MKLSVCLLASEVAPLSKTGGLADVSSALSKYLVEAGHDARVFTPWYRKVGTWPAAEIVEGMQDVPLEVGPQTYEFSLYTTPLPGSSVPVYLIDCPELFGRPTIYTVDPDEHLRFLAFTRAVLVSCGRLEWAPAIVHCNDWHTSFAPLFLKTEHGGDPYLARARTVLTIHNVGYQGIFAADDIADLGLGIHEDMVWAPDLARGQINALRHGILYADALTTVSPTHAKEICSDQYGMGLQDSLRARQSVLTGILNGVDYSVWDPRIDHHLPMHFDADHLAVKAALKQELIHRLSVKAGPETALGGIVGRLASQKGIELLTQALRVVLPKRDFAFVALGAGEPQYEEMLTKLAADFPGRVVFRKGYDDELAHWIEGACDLFVMPSLYEPSGLNQMYSLRYGTLPVVRRTGGLADSVEPYDPRTGLGTGVLFEEISGKALALALETALNLYASPLDWSRVIRNGMSRDFSWDRQGARYVEIYHSVVEG